MKVALVWPEVLDLARYRERRREFPPFGVLYIAAVLEEAGHEVILFKLTPDQLRFDFRDFDAVGFSISASATFNLFLECRFHSLFRSDALLLAGGVHANLFPEQTLLDLQPHVVGIGEGEETVVEILRRHRGRNFADVPGVCFLEEGRPRRTATRALTRDISCFPFPARHLLDRRDFILDDRLSDLNLPMTHLVPGRGCPFPCRYCASAQTGVQLRSGANVRAELIHLIENYGIEGFAIVGNDFILSKQNVHDVCDHIRDLKLTWQTLTRVDRVDRTTLRQMKQAGCHELEFGVESGSQRLLDAMDKRATVEQAKTALRWSWEAGLKNKVFLVHGYPGEDRASTAETMDLLDEVGRYIHRASLLRFVPLPGTYAYNHAAELDIRGTNRSPDWDGDWGKYHIHHNNRHWWGSDEQFVALTESYECLRRYVEDRWPPRFAADELAGDRWEEQSKAFAQAHPRVTAVPASPLIQLSRLQ